MGERPRVFDRPQHVVAEPREESAGVFPELVEDRRTGLLVGPKDPAALADAVEGLLKEPDKRQSLLVAARRKVENSFECWETTKAVQTLLQVGASR